MSQMIVKTQELTKQYGHHRAVSSISMRVRKGGRIRTDRKERSRKNNFLKNAGRACRSYERRD